jgi:hypothetical protein
MLERCPSDAFIGPLVLVNRDSPLQGVLEIACERDSVLAWSLNKDERLVDLWKAQGQPKIKILALLRVRNEELLLRDTLDHLAGFAQAIVAYDDASTDRTYEILTAHPAVALVVRNTRWQDGAEARLAAETRHRGLLYALARKRFAFAWCFCADADERYSGAIAAFPDSLKAVGVDGVRVRLFDAYLTPEDSAPYQAGQPLANFRRFFGPERRDILMFWRNVPEVDFRGLDSREPQVDGNIIHCFECQHYGKSLSSAHWDETCRYYRDHFPYETYGKKWEARLGKALHTQSDFGRPLYPWGEELLAAADPAFERGGLPPRHALVATSRLVELAGSEILAIEVAEWFAANAFAVTLAAFDIAPSLRRACEANGIPCVDLTREPLDRKSYDCAWYQHGVMADYLTHGLKVTAARVAAISLSHMEPLETPPSPDVPVSAYLVHTLENEAYFRERYPAYCRRLAVFPNAAPRPFFDAFGKARNPTLTNLAIVSNHVPDEMIEAAALLRARGVNVVLYGPLGQRTRITADVLKTYDAVVTIGKTVQYALAAGVAVFCYDHFGGPGWINRTTFDAACAKNFSGRCQPVRQTAETLADNLLNGYAAARAEAAFLHEKAEELFDFDKNMRALWAGLPEATPTESLSPTARQVLANNGALFMYMILAARNDRRYDETPARLAALHRNPLVRLAVFLSRTRHAIKTRLRSLLRRTTL